MTKDGHAMTHVEIEDFAGTIRAVAFSDCVEKHGALLKEDGIVFAVGAVDRKMDRPRIKDTAK